MVVVLSEKAERYRGNRIVAPTLIDSFEETPIFLCK